ncbi:expressed conserved protein [Echinococcus multilocularis]|uniref:Expressed conserved protein n=1 Tax=Echinococcus multilocularis TaxID=6211 RepID=A0A068YAJ1_ECHMU|nr:expressed conserved protein [Echinococcus multilocularis]
MSFEDWCRTLKFNLHLYPLCQGIPLILHALPYDLFLAVVDVIITHDTDIDQCCNAVAQLVIDREEQTIARGFSLRFQKASEYDEKYTRNLQLLSERAFCGCPPNKVSNWVTVQFRHGVRPPTLSEKLCDGKTNLLGQLVKLATTSVGRGT